MERSAARVNPSTDIGRSGLPVGNVTSALTVGREVKEESAITSSVRVVSVPAGHPYVSRVLDSPEIDLLPDPLPVGAAPGVWWPPVVLGPGWIEGHSVEADVLHLHFGLESFGSDELVEAVEAAHAAGWVVVQTVHDLENPQLADQAVHVAQLDALLPIVDSVITLTRGAADEIRRRWDRMPLVLPHPRLATATAEGIAVEDVESVPAGRRARVGVHLKDLRPNVDGPGTVAALLAALDLLAGMGVGVDLEVRLHDRVRDPDARDAVLALCAGRDGVTVLEHGRLADPELERALAGLDACVLPYRAGTHSGWLELCWDLGVAVAVPEVGFFVEQHEGATIAPFTVNEPVSLAAALHRILEASPPPGSHARRLLVAARRRERDSVDRATAAAHRDLYRSLVRGRVE